ncbi:ABC transporter ATP-binding protein [Rhodococcus erythropolis]|uniref:ABC transporter ATP-binding protein n=1 Tax=Rhodococcus erythropolis TaxID=1833 RepID=UPI00294A1D7F|nr:ABC transporter ATP-binding protein [Rhodococcus erythropolis]MDV6278457.1 ABC transporter ATP-binding protein [Rhodococcus erythropolis]
MQPTDHPSAPRLHVESVSKSFGDDDLRVCAVDGASVTVNSGEIVALTGPSGCGKSTLLAIAAGLSAPDTGRVLIDGQSLYEIEAGEFHRFRRNNIGLVFQDYNLLRTLTVIENVMIVDELNGLSRVKARSRAAAALEMVGLQEFFNRYPAQLSGGQQQRVSIARAVCGSPRLILADEPTGALDTDNADAIVRLLEKIVGEGGACLIVTHDLSIAERATRSVSMKDGRIRHAPSMTTVR